jgi:hypothetical protein
MVPAAAQPGPTQHALPSTQYSRPTVGGTAASDSWEVHLTAYGPYERFVALPPAIPPRGALVVAEFTARSRQEHTATFTASDFAIVAGDGRRFGPAAQTGSVEHGIWLVEAVQPDQDTARRVVFDVDPTAHDLTLELLGLVFRVPA